MEAAVGAGALGARMMGGGFGGSVIALVPEDATAVRAAVCAAYDSRGWPRRDSWGAALGRRPPPQLGRALLVRFASLSPRRSMDAGSRRRRSDRGRPGRSCGTRDPPRAGDRARPAADPAEGARARWTACRWSSPWAGRSARSRRCCAARAPAARCCCAATWTRCR